MACLTEEMLLLLARGELTTPETEAADVHLDACPACREVLALTIRASLAWDPGWTGIAAEEVSVATMSPLETSGLVPGSRLGRYVVGEPVGTGAMSIVFRARDPELEREVALKVIRPAAWALHGDALQERLQREARAMARLTHPNVVTVYDVGKIGEVIFVAMEYVPGGTLRQWLHAAPRSWQEVLDVFLRAGRGLAAAHAAGLVHRDFKPDNILVADDGRVRVADFGLARIQRFAAEMSATSVEPAPLAAMATASTTGLFVGTPAYMAPEVPANGRVDARSDLFSFCVSLFEALYGGRPFDGATPAAIVRAIERGEVRDPPPGSTIPTWVRQPLLRGLRARPEERQPSMEVLLAQLSRDPAGRRRRLWPVLVAAALVVVALGMTQRSLRSWVPARLGLAGRDHPRLGGGESEDLAAAEEAFPASRRYDDFSSGGLSGTRWNDGEYEAAVRDRAATLRHAIQKVQAFRTHATELVIRPPSNGEVTTLQTDVVVDSATATGDTSSGAAIDLWFQPAANRLSFPFNTNSLLIARVILEQLAQGPLIARYYILLCRENFEDCSQGQFIGPARSPKTWPANAEAYGATWRGAPGQMTGTWRQVIPVSLGTVYTISISVNSARTSLTFAISDRAGLSLSSSVDLSGTKTPFSADLTFTNFYRARLLTRMSGGNFGGGDGSVSARFDNVRLGVDGGAPSLFDDFDTGTTFDPRRWSVGAKSALVSGGALSLSLDQSDHPSLASLEMADTSASALQADVTVARYRSTGTGRIAAQLREALYNDGSAGIGVAPDDNEPNSQVGDVAASISITDAEAFYAVVRCDTAQCSSTGVGLTYIQPFTSLGKATSSTTHTLYLNWDAKHHRVQFRLDRNPVVEFDPVAVGYPVMSGPRVHSKRIAVQATSAKPADAFTLGSSGSMTAMFANVRTN